MSSQHQSTKWRLNLNLDAGDRESQAKRRFTAASWLGAEDVSLGFSFNLKNTPGLDKR
jgi:hypothetical protein